MSDTIISQSRHFSLNKYYLWYFKLILSANSKKRKRTKKLYLENHHIIPKSIGGSNTNDNLVFLTAREHYIAHWLLTKFCIKQAKRKMNMAFYAMNKMATIKQKRYKNSIIYERVRSEASILWSGENNGMYGKSHSEETKKIIKEKNKLRYKLEPERKKIIGDFHRGKKMSKESRAKMSESHIGHEPTFTKGTHSEESKIKMSLKRKGRKHSPEHAEKLRKILFNSRLKASSTQKHILSKEENDFLTNNYHKLSMKNILVHFQNEFKRNISRTAIIRILKEMKIYKI